ncbi:MAG: hypothetical protein EBZ69_00355 [Alphaproteobacteria bacterium]|nr:hypothetical protein [Alphaproteobacteria bacterium]
MPYFQVRVAQTQLKDFIVQATDRLAAKDIAAEAASFDPDLDGQILKKYKNVALIGYDSNESFDTQQAPKTDWLAALKKQKEK